LASTPSVPDDLRRFLESNVDSVEQLELLRLCGGNADSLWPFAEMAALIQTTLDHARSHISLLERRGLLRVDRQEAEPRCGLALLDPERWALLQRLLALYNERPVTLIRWVYAHAQDPLRAFADAFRIRKEP
jgi:hypothetical protein